MRYVAAIAWLVLLTQVVRGQPAILRVDGKPPTRVVVTATTEPPASPVDDAPMARRAVGILGTLEGPAINQLVGVIPLNPQSAPLVEDTERVVVLHVMNDEGTRRLLDIARTPAGELVLRNIDDLASDTSRVSMDHTLAWALLQEWSTYRGSIDAVPAGTTVGNVFELKEHAEPSAITLDIETLRRRVYRGMNIDAKPADRKLTQAKFFVRLPREYTPRTPAGLVVWVDPTDAGIPPRQFDAALDELNMIAIGSANTGNDRDPSDRMQLALDAAMTAMTHFHIDASRVYVVGMSGGGRIAAMMWGSFPDVFRGAVPICGMSAYRNASAGAGKAWPAMFAKPGGDLLTKLRTSRLGAITGMTDFNSPNVEAYVKVLDMDQMDVRLFKYDDLGHDLPGPTRFAEVLKWVDEPARKRLDSAAQRAEMLLKRVEAGVKNEPPTQKQREQLSRVLSVAPWSEPAWRALKLLEHR